MQARMHTHVRAHTHTHTCMHKNTFMYQRERDQEVFEVLTAVAITC